MVVTASFFPTAPSVTPDRYYAQAEIYVIGSSGSLCFGCGDMVFRFSKNLPGIALATGEMRTGPQGGWGALGIRALQRQTKWRRRRGPLPDKDPEGWLSSS